MGSSTWAAPRYRTVFITHNGEVKVQFKDRLKIGKVLYTTINTEIYSRMQHEMESASI